MKKCFAALLCAVLLLTACSAPAQETAAASGDAVRIGLLFDTFVVERWQRDRDIFVSTARQLGAQVTVQNANGDADKQAAQMEQMIEDEMDVIVVVPIDSGPLAGLVKKARSAGIRVISYDRLILNAPVDLYISFDNYTVGKLMAQAVGEQLASGDKVLMLCGPTTDSNTAEVTQGFTEALSGTGIILTDVYHCEDWKAEYAAQYVREHEDEIAETQAIMCGNDNLASLAVQALAEQQLAGKICVVAQDADLDACQRVVEGTQYMTVYKPVDKLAAAAAQAAVDMANGTLPETDRTISNGTEDVPYICLEPVAVKKDNMESTIIDSGFHLKEDVYLNCPEQLPGASSAVASASASN
jgi:D-xylose transport system substrate-binding protein